MIQSLGNYINSSKIANLNHFETTDIQQCKHFDKFDNYYNTNTYAMKINITLSTFNMVFIRQYYELLKFVINLAWKWIGNEYLYETSSFCINQSKN